MQKIDKKWKNAFFALKSGRLGVFDAQFWNKFQSKPKIWLHQKLTEVSTWKTINSWKFLLHPKKDAIKFTLGGEEKIPSPVLIGLKSTWFLNTLVYMIFGGQHTKVFYIHMVKKKFVLYWGK